MTRGCSATSDLLTPLEKTNGLEDRFVSSFYLTIGRAMKNETSQTMTIIIATRFEFLCRAYLSGFVTAM